MPVCAAWPRPGALASTSSSTSLPLSPLRSMMPKHVSERGPLVAPSRSGLRSWKSWTAGSRDRGVECIRLGGLGAPIGAMKGDRMVNAIHAVVEGLGGHTTFGRTLRTEGDLRVAIREGFPQTVVEDTRRSAGLTLKQLAKTLSLSPRSLQRRRPGEEPGARWRRAARFDR